MSFAFPIRVYWEDTDAGGIVFYANHLKFFERARTEWLRSLGISQSTLRVQTGGVFVVSETSVRYLRPAKLDDRLRVTARLVDAGRASMVIAQQAWRLPDDVTEFTPGADGETGDLLSEGTIRIGWVDAATLRPSRIPSSVLEALKVS